MAAGQLEAAPAWARFTATCCTVSSKPEWSVAGGKCSAEGALRKPRGDRGEESLRKGNPPAGAPGGLGYRLQSFLPWACAVSSPHQDRKPRAAETEEEPAWHRRGTQGGCLPGRPASPWQWERTCC